MQSRAHLPFSACTDPSVAEARLSKAVRKLQSHTGLVAASGCWGIKIRVQGPQKLELEAQASDDLWDKDLHTTRTQACSHQSLSSSLEQGLPYPI